jgi:hypothetical protein
VDAVFFNRAIVLVEGVVPSRSRSIVKGASDECVIQCPMRSRLSLGDTVMVDQMIGLLSAAVRQERQTCEHASAVVQCGLAITHSSKIAA